MHLNFRNVNDAFHGLVHRFHQPDWYYHEGLTPPVKGRYSNPNGAGEVLYFEEPVLVTYHNPTERVLLNTARDANPFFMLYEALWMLAGMDDVASLAYYNPRVSRYSDDGKVFNGAYGRRWRRASTLGSSLIHNADYLGGLLASGNMPEVDQLQLVASQLRHNPLTRRAVLDMWTVEDDLVKCEGTFDAEYARLSRELDWCWCDDGGRYPECQKCITNRKLLGDLAERYPISRDVCCNLNVVFQLRRVGGTTGGFIEDPDCPPVRPVRPAGQVTPGPVDSLDMTVTARSSDLTYGFLGSDYVCFSLLHEYMAACLGPNTLIGKFNHLTTNLHVYLDRWEPGKWLSRYEYDNRSSGPVQNTVGQARIRHRDGDYSDEGRESLSGHQITTQVPLVARRGTFSQPHFDEELRRFVKAHSSAGTSPGSWSIPFLRDVAEPMFMAFHGWKWGGATASMWVNQIKDDAWRLAARTWLERRLKQPLPPVEGQG